MKIKQEYIGKVIIKGSSRIVLRDDMTAKEVLWVKNILGSHLVDEIGDIEVIEEPEVTIDEIKPTPRKRKRK